jgi:hypothetical protein
MRNFILKYFTYLFILFFSGLAHGQSKKQDVIYLKNGGIFRGVITNLKTDSLLKIKLQSGNELLVPSVDIDKIKREKIIKKSIFEKEIKLQQPKLKFAARINYAAGFHTSFGNTKTITQQILLEAGIQFRNKLFIGAGGGLVNYSNLESRKGMLINGKNDYLASPYQNATVSSTALNHGIVHLSFNVPIHKFKNFRLESAIRGGYFVYNPEVFYTTIFYTRRNNTINYKKNLISSYLNRPFINPGLNFTIPTNSGKNTFIFSISYFMDFMALNYNYIEDRFIYTNNMNSYEGYWQRTETIEKINTQLNTVTLSIGVGF